MNLGNVNYHEPCFIRGYLQSFLFIYLCIYIYVYLFNPHISSGLSSDSDLFDELNLRLMYFVHSGNVSKLIFTGLFRRGDLSTSFPLLSFSCFRDKGLTLIL